MRLRATVSTSGSSGTGIYQDIVTVQPDRVGGHTDVGGEVVAAGDATEFPGMPGTDDMLAMHGAGPRGPPW